MRSTFLVGLLFLLQGTLISTTPIPQPVYTSISQDGVFTKSTPIVPRMIRNTVTGPKDPEMKKAEEAAKVQKMEEAEKLLAEAKEALAEAKIQEMEKAEKLLADAKEALAEAKVQEAEKLLADSKEALREAASTFRGPTDALVTDALKSIGFKTSTMPR